MLNLPVRTVSDAVVVRAENTFVPKWSSLRGLGNNRLLRTSYFWLVFVPITVKVFENAESIVNISLFGDVYTLHIELPFSWAILFYSAVLTSGANLIYSVSCPSIIKDFQTYDEFGKQGRGQGQLMKEFTKAISREGYSPPGIEDYNDGGDSQHPAIIVVRNFALHSDSRLEDALSLERQASEARTDSKHWFRASDWDRFISFLDATPLDPQKLGDAFWFVRNAAERNAAFFRGACTILYYMGLGLIGYLVLQNVLVVVRFHLSS
jgi:hypothetical protein